MECVDVDQIHVVQGIDQWQALVNIVMNHQLPCKVGNFLASWATFNFSRRSLLHGFN